MGKINLRILSACVLSLFCIDSIALAPDLLAHTKHKPKSKKVAKYSKRKKRRVVTIVHVYKCPHHDEILQAQSVIVSKSGLAAVKLPETKASASSPIVKDTMANVAISNVETKPSEENFPAVEKNYSKTTVPVFTVSPISGMSNYTFAPENKNPGEEKNSFGLKEKISPEKNFSDENIAEAYPERISVNSRFEVHPYAADPEKNSSEKVQAKESSSERNSSKGPVQFIREKKNFLPPLLRWSRPVDGNYFPLRADQAGRNSLEERSVE